MGSNCDSVENNFCKSFNHAIVDVGFYPIIFVQENIRKRVFVVIQEQRAKGDIMLRKVCPIIFRKLKKSITLTQYLEVLWKGGDGFEVKHINGSGRQ